MATLHVPPKQSKRAKSVQAELPPDIDQTDLSPCYNLVDQVPEEDQTGFRQPVQPTKSVDKRSPRDSAYKYLFKHKRIFLQLLQSFVDTDFVQGLRLKDLNLEDKSFVSAELLDRESDLLYRIRHGGRRYYIYILLEFQSTVDKFIPLRMGLYILMLYDHLYHNSRRGLLPNVFPLLLYSGKKPWTSSLNLRDLIATNIPARYVPSLEYYPIIGRNVSDKYLERLHNLVAAVIYMEKQRNEDGLRNALERVIDYLKDESIFAIRAFTVWLTSVFRADVPPESIERIRDIKEARSMLTELAERIERKGKREGKLEGKLEAARLMLSDGLSVEQVMKYTGLDMEVILENANDT
jgi:predicted transposase/invertase (TIGR01784 family)